jgi:predicted lipase
VFAAKLLFMQAAGALPTYSGDPRDQIKLYTFGAPSVGNTEFAAYLEENMLERYRCAAQAWLLSSFVVQQRTGCSIAKHLSVNT